MATSPLFGWEEPDDTDLVKDGAAAIRTLGNAIDTSMGDLLGGTTGQILSKASNTNMDFTWVAPTTGDITGVTAGTGISGGGTSGDVTITNSMATAITTAGDLIKGTGSGTFARLGIGSTGQVLTVSGGAPVWSTPAGSSPTSATAYVATAEGTTSTSYTDLGTSGAAVTVTTGTKALVFLNCQANADGASRLAAASFAISGATTLAASDKYSIGIYGTTSYVRAAGAWLVTGLTAGSNTFTMKYKAVSAYCDFAYRHITVVDMGS